MDVANLVWIFFWLLKGNGLEVVNLWLLKGNGLSRERVLAISEAETLSCWCDGQGRRHGMSQRETITDLVPFNETMNIPTFPAEHQRVVYFFRWTPETFSVKFPQ